MKTAFCINCDEKNPYSINYRKVYVNILEKGIHYIYKEKYATCNKCGKEVYVPKINDINVTNREKAFNKVRKKLDNFNST